MRRLKRFVRPLFLRALRASGLYVFWVLSREGPLIEDGWFKSFAAGAAIDAEGNPLPWLPYPVIDFLERRIRPDMAVFEYGCGNSTLWWARRVRQVVSCEHDPGWHAKISAASPSNAEVILEEDPDRYEAAAGKYPGHFDIVVIDGTNRIGCAASAVKALNPNGVIVWDDSEREEYQSGLAFLKTCGLKQLPLTGLAPPYPKKSETSIFYREGNCLEI